jgi:DNA polymerase I-like protein with 3'-5' exonuclease and polymerase domains
MALIIWTGADTPLISKTIGQTLKAMRPAIPEHKFIPLVEGELPPEPGLGDILVACGTKAVTMLQEHKVLPKGRTPSSLREKPIKFGQGQVMVTYDPMVTGSEPEKMQTIDWDFRLATRLMTTGSLKPQIGTYKWVNTYQPMIDWIDQQYEETGQPVDVSMDTETETFFPWYEERNIVSISFTAIPETAEVLYLGPQEDPIEIDHDEPLFDQIKWLLTSPKVKLRGANLKYDLIWIAVKWGIECTNFKFDTMLVGALLDEHRANSLNMHAKIASTMGGYDDGFNAKYDKSKMGSVPAGDDLLTYAGGDTDACQRVANVFKDQLLEDERLTKFYIRILHPAARAFEKVERRGVLVDQQKFAILRDDLDKVIKDNYTHVIELLPQKMKWKYKDRIAEQMAAGKSPMLPSILQEYFFSPNGLNLKPLVRTKTGIASTAKAHLKMFGDTPEAKAMVEALTLGDQASKTKSTFVDGFIKCVRPDGYIHPTYFLVFGEYEGQDKESGTDTGRLSAKDPAFQIIPKKTKWAKRIRECYPAPPGKVILLLDFSQGELRVVACVANEKNMIKAYEQGMDLHGLTGAQLSQVSYEEFQTWKKHQEEAKQALFKEMRDRAKAGNFGLLYGMGAEGFQAYAWANYGLKLTLAEAEAIRAAFFTLYPGLTNYHETQRKFVKLHEHVRSPLGRVAHLPMVKAWDREIRAKAERKAINSPIQSCLSDMMIWAIALIEENYPNDEIAVVGMIHDALVAYVDEDKVQLRAKQASEIMSNLPFGEIGWHPQLVFPADAEAGINLASLEEVKLYA